jgi:cytochrome b involved in lipid metabolism
MKRELWINSALGFISVIIIGIIIIRAAPVQTPASPTGITNNQTITITDFARHNTAGDCWIRINGNVYDVTNFLSMHPGGPDFILPFCGGPDATGAFATKDGRGTHSPRAEELLKQMLVGTLSQ